MANPQRAVTLEKSIKDLSAHLVAVTEDPSIPLDAKLIGPFECFAAGKYPITRFV
jgi:hypothetical protein